MSLAEVIADCQEAPMNRWISITAAAIITIALAVLLVLGPKAANVENLRATMLAYGPWAVGISIALMVAQAIIAPLPMNVVTITNALVFGPLWGSLLSWFSTVLGASLCFLLSKTFGKPFAQKLIGSSMEKAESFFQTYGLHAMFIVRVLPLIPFDAISYGAPLVGVPFSRFLLATAVGIIPSILIYSFLGTLIARIYWWVLIGLLCAALVGIIAAAQIVRKRPKPAPAKEAVNELGGLVS
jgi:uncharacterized membrane protein YdjX (TVP38/TMEM64 family)